jgi:hypothetical protein
VGAANKDVAKSENSTIFFMLPPPQVWPVHCPAKSLLIRLDHGSLERLKRIIFIKIGKAGNSPEMKMSLTIGNNIYLMN